MGSPSERLAYLTLACKELSKGTLTSSSSSSSSSSLALSRLCGQRILRIVSDGDAGGGQAGMLPTMSVVCSGCGVYMHPGGTAEVVFPTEEQIFTLRQSYNNTDEHTSPSNPTPPQSEPWCRAKQLHDLSRHLDPTRITAHYSLLCRGCGTMTITAVQETLKAAKRKVAAASLPKPKGGAKTAVVTEVKRKKKKNMRSLG